MEVESEDGFREWTTTSVSFALGKEVVAWWMYEVYIYEGFFVNGRERVSLDKGDLASRML
jgi:hypothetical protein